MSDTFLVRRKTDEILKVIDDTDFDELTKAQFRLLILNITNLYENISSYKDTIEKSKEIDSSIDAEEMLSLLLDICEKIFLLADIIIVYIIKNEKKKKDLINDKVIYRFYVLILAGISFIATLTHSGFKVSLGNLLKVLIDILG